jgi:hypothetical protein
MTANQSETVIEDLSSIQERFVHEAGRFTKSEMLEKFINDDELSQEARTLAADAVERMYHGVVWEDDVFGNQLVAALDIVIIRYQRSNS